MNVQGPMGHGRAYGFDGPKMTAEKQEKLEEIISRYDPENFTKEDLLSLRQDLTDAGIPRDRKIAGVIKDAGLNLEKEENGQQGEAMARPEGVTIRDLLKQYKEGMITKDELADEIEAIKDSIENPNGLLVDTST